MCGIVAFLGGNYDSINEKTNILNDQMDVIRHRGPSGSGEYVDDQVALGFRRLSIIDLSKGNQPIYNENEDKLIFFNGEIYNYQEIRNELIKLGHHFKTESDTETILVGYDEWGEDIVHRLRGMFMFIIYDTKTKKMFGARDYYGIKPFYYAKLDDGTIMLGSEIKSFMVHPKFKKSVNKEALSLFLQNQYNDSEDTFFEGVKMFPAGHYFEYDGDEFNISEYWDAKYQESSLSFEETVNRIDKSVVDSVKAHAISDVPVGAFLSEGVDSSYVTSILKPDEVFSVGFDDKTYDETSKAEILAKEIGSNFNKSVVDADEAFDSFDKIQYYLDEPDGNPSCIPLWFLTKAAAKKVTVALSGEGADELFAGYVNYGKHTHNLKIEKLTAMFKKMPITMQTGLASIVKKMPPFHGRDNFYTNLANPRDFFAGESLIYSIERPSIFSPSEVKDIINPELFKDISVNENYQSDFDKVAGNDRVKQMQYIDQHHFMMHDILQKADKISMAHSLELRVPFLDIEVSKVANETPSKYLLTEEDTKFALRKASQKHLPEEWANRAKLGFPVPIKKWLTEDKFYNQVKSVFENSFVNDFFDQTKILQMLADNKAGKIDARRKIWTIFTFLTWYKVYFIDLDKYLKLG